MIAESSFDPENRRPRGVGATHASPVGAATIGLGLAWWRTAALNRQAASGAVQAAVSRREHAADVFSRAVGQIGSDRVEVRIGAILSLAALSRDFPELSQPMFDVLAAYSRTRSEDFRAEDPNLSRAYFPRANLPRSVLERATLRRIVLWEANLRDSTLAYADLREADLRRANLHPSRATPSRTRPA